MYEGKQADTSKSTAVGSTAQAAQGKVPTSSETPVPRLIPGSLINPKDLLNMQQTVGNRQVGHFLASLPGSSSIREAGAERGPELCRSNLLQRAFKGKLTAGEVRPRQVPQIDLTPAQLNHLEQTASRIGEPSSRPLPGKLLNGEAQVKNNSIEVPSLFEHNERSNAADLTERLSSQQVKDAAVRISGSRYSLMLRENPWYEAVSGKLMQPQPGGAGSEGETRSFGEVTAVWHDSPPPVSPAPSQVAPPETEEKMPQMPEAKCRAQGINRPRRSVRPTIPFSFDNVHKHQEELKAAQVAKTTARRQERQQRQQHALDLGKQGVQIDPGASWGMEKALTSAHDAPRPPERRHQAVSAMHLPYMPDGKWGPPAVSQQRSSKVTGTLLQNWTKRRQLPEPRVLPPPGGHVHAEPTGQLDFLQQMALAFEQGQEMPLFSLEASSRGRCDKCDSNPEEMGLQGLVVKDPERRLHDDTAHWDAPQGFPEDFTDDFGEIVEDESQPAIEPETLQQEEKPGKIKGKREKPSDSDAVREAPSWGGNGPGSIDPYDNWGENHPLHRRFHREDEDGGDGTAY